MVALRTLSKERVDYPPSHCTACKHRLGVRDLVPVLSWLSLCGKCRYCKESISRIYPFGELLTATYYAILVYKFGITVNIIPHIVLATVLVLATQTDIKEMIVPDRFIVLGLLIVLPVRVLMGGWVTYVVGGIVIFTFLYIIYRLSGRKMGGADVKIYCLTGIVIGLVESLNSLTYAAVVTLIVLIPKFIGESIERNTEIPFIPYITIGVILTYIINI